MYKNKQLDIKPDFQRDVVWPRTAQTRFIDSLVKQLPIPSMCISLDYNTGSRLMIDGLQRIWSVISFLDDDEFKMSRLDDIDSRVSGRSVKVIKEKHGDIVSRIENLTIPVTVLRCDYNKKSHMEYLFTIFHRLNTGGNKLSNQEIRNCIYQGRFNDLIKHLAAEDSFRSCFGLEDQKSYRFQYEEFILRVLAMDHRYEKYTGKLSRFLNEYMDDHQDLDEEKCDAIRLKFERTVSVIYNKILSRKQLPRISRATTEAIFVGVMRNLPDIEGAPAKDAKAAFKAIREHEEFSLVNLKSGLSHTDKVKSRLNTAIEIVADAC